MTDLATDAELVARARTRDAAAFAVLAARYRQRLVGVAFARCRDVALAEDVVQDALVAAWDGLAALRDGDRIGPWLAGIARNLATSAARTRDRRGKIVFVAPELAAIEAAEASDPRAALLAHEDRELFERALADVAAQHRDILVRYYLDGESLARIAADRGISEVAAKKQLSRARDAVRAAVAARTDGALARLRDRSRPLAAVAPSLGKAALMATTKQLAIVGAVAACAIGGGVAFWWHGRGTAAPVAPAPSVAATTITGSAAAPAIPDAILGSAGPAPLTSVHVQRLAKPAREALLAQIHSAQAARARAAATTGAGAAPPPPALIEGGSDDSADYDKSYIKAAVHEIIPMLTDCYDEAITRDPKIGAGDITVDFTIEGDKDVGGLVGTSKIFDGKTTLADATLRECISETMYGLKLDPPPSGNTVTVRYPFAFAPGAPDDGSGSAR